MALFGFPPLGIKITALALNLLVAAIGAFHFLKAGQLSWRNVYPFAGLAFPFSLLRGAIQLSEEVYYPVVGVVLVLSALEMVRSALRHPGTSPALPDAPPFWTALATGAPIGFVSDNRNRRWRVPRAGGSRHKLENAAPDRRNLSPGLPAARASASRQIWNPCFSRC